MYMLNLDANARVLSVSVCLGKISDDVVVVESFPTDRSITDYRFMEGEFVYDPLPTAAAPPRPRPSIANRIAALEQQLSDFEAAYNEGVQSA